MTNVSTARFAVASVERCARFVVGALARIGWRQWGVVVALSLFWGLANLYAHVTYTPPEITQWDAYWLIYMAQMVFTGLMLQSAISFVEHARARPTVAHYLLAGAVALTLAVCVDFLLFYVLEVIPTGFSGSTPREQAVHRVITIAGLLFLEGQFVVLIYARLRIARRAQHALAASELERASATRQVLATRLSAMQAQIEPRFLFNVLTQVEACYGRSLADGERMLNGLIAYLRAALPRFRGDSSTLGDEAELVRTYLSLVEMRMGGRLSVDLDVPEDLRGAAFPPMLLMPLADNALRHGLEPCPLGGRISVYATRQGDRLRVRVSDDGGGHLDTIVEGQGLLTLRDRLRGLYADQATLVIASNRPQGIVATVDLPCEIPTAAR